LSNLGRLPLPKPPLFCYNFIRCRFRIGILVRHSKIFWRILNLVLEEGDETFMKVRIIISLCVTFIFPALIWAEEPPVERWVARYNSASRNSDSPVAIAVDNLENVYVTGRTHDGNNYDYATVKYDTNGNQLWVARYNGPGDTNDSAVGLAVDNFGNVYVTGTSSGSWPSRDYTTVKYSTDGNQLWATRYNGPGDSYDRANAIGIDSLGNVYVTGESCGNGTGSDYATIKYDPNGNQVWAARYNGPGNYTDYANALVIDNFGSVYVTGASFGTYADYTTIKYDTNGNTIWVSRYNSISNGDGVDAAKALAVDTQGNVYVTGHAYDSGNVDYRRITVKYDPNGNQLWAARYDGPANGYDNGIAIAPDNLGNVYVTGTSEGVGTGYDYATIKYDQYGNEVWVARYNDSANGYDSAYGLAVDNAGNIYVTGTSDSNYATIKYDSNGNQSWVVTYNGPSNSQDICLGLCVDDSGNVYVTGSSVDSNTGYDYATIKYTQHDYCIQQIEGDYNGDCKVEFRDFAMLADAWLNDYTWQDLKTLADDWLNCNFALEEDCW
jgi:hypothetical protein